MFFYVCIFYYLYLVIPAGRQCIQISIYMRLRLQRHIGSKHVLTYVCMHAVFIFIHIQHIYMYTQIYIRDTCVMCGASRFGAHMISNSFIGFDRNINDTEANMLADVQSSQSRIAIRESCTSICDVIPVVNDILRIHQDTVLLFNYCFHISVGAHSGITINFFNVRRIRL